MVEHGADVGLGEGAVDGGIGEEGWRRGGDGEAVEAVVGGVGQDQLRPEGELAGAGGEVWLQGVEGREGGVGWEAEGAAGGGV